MKEIVGVGFVHGGKSYYFDPQGEEYNLGDMVIVETARGMELGHVMIGNCQVDDSRIVAPLKPVQRRATDEDLERYKQNYAKKGEAMKICQEKIQNRGLDMKLVDAEYTIDGSKVIFYFSSENRVDFRDLVKDLASHFRMRIELRQIGVRDEARMLGGIGICGRPFCCSKWLSDFQPVSIKMAKNQNLSLNPSKISGSCGRLMCCLNFENDTYVDLRKGMPSEGQKLNTRDGQIKVMSVDLIRGTVVTRDIIKDKETGEESLSTETRTFTKEEINEMTGHGHCSCCRGEDKFEMAYQDGTVSGAVDTGDFSGDSWTADPENIDQKEIPAEAAGNDGRKSETSGISAGSRPHRDAENQTGDSDLSQELEYHQNPEKEHIHRGTNPGKGRRKKAGKNKRMARNSGGDSNRKPKNEEDSNQDNKNRPGKNSGRKNENGKDGGKTGKSEDKNGSQTFSKDDVKSRRRRSGKGRNSRPGKKENREKNHGHEGKADRPENGQQK